MPKAVVLYTRYRYADPDSDQTLSANKGDEIDVSQAEFDRGSSMQPPALAKAGSDAAKAAAGDQPAGETGLPDDLTKLSKKDLVALAEQMNVENPGKLSHDELLAAVADAPGARP